MDDSSQIQLHMTAKDMSEWQGELYKMHLCSSDAPQMYVEISDLTGTCPQMTILFPRLERSPHLLGRRRRGERMSHYNLASFAILVPTVILSPFKKPEKKSYF